MGVKGECKQENRRFWLWNWIKELNIRRSDYLKRAGVTNEVHSGVDLKHSDLVL